MHPTSTGIVHLPAHHPAAIDPELVAADEGRLTEVAQTLEQAVDDVTARLDSARRSPAGHGQASVDRDAEIHRLAARLRRLQRYGPDACLGRTVPVTSAQPADPLVPTGTSDPGLTDDGTVYVGRHGLADSDGRQLLVDWRSPAAEPFFAATPAHPMGIAGRRRYRWHRGQLVDLWDEVITPGPRAPEAEAEAEAADPRAAFVASLGGSRTGRMRDVLGTIQTDQDAIIRAGSRGALVVDGGPGTGKTVVALHRCAFLLYADPLVDQRRGGVLVVGPHQPYLDYVSDVLPDLGEDGVLSCTLADLVPEGRGALPEADAEVARLKGTVEMVEAVDAAVRFYEQPPAEELLVETPWAEVRLGPDEWARAFDAPDPGTPHHEARDMVWDEIVSIVADGHDDVAPDELDLVLRRDTALVTTLGRAWPTLDPADLVADLWEVPAYLRRCAPHLSPDDRARLRRPAGSTWTRADLPLLDAARHRLGDDRASRERDRQHATVAAEREYRSHVVDELVAADLDGESEVVMLRSDDLADALAGAFDPLARPGDSLSGPFAHLVVDEAQELTDAEWLMLLRRCPSRSLTVVGDRAQARSGFVETWEARLRRVGLDDVTVAPLTYSYRTPAAIMESAEAVIRAQIPDANVPVSVRPGGEPVCYGAVADLPSVLDTWLSAHPEGTACVVGETTLQPVPRVRFLPPELTKGLEFDLVVLVDPESFGSGVQGAVDRYIAMTRATEQLVVLGAGAGADRGERVPGSGA